MYPSILALPILPPLYPSIPALSLPLPSMYTSIQALSILPPLYPSIPGLSPLLLLLSPPTLPSYRSGPAGWRLPRWRPCPESPPGARFRSWPAGRRSRSARSPGTGSGTADLSPGKQKAGRPGSALPEDCRREGGCGQGGEAVRETRDERGGWAE